MRVVRLKIYMFVVVNFGQALENAPAFVALLTLRKSKSIFKKYYSFNVTK